MFTNPLYLIKGVFGRTFYIFPQRPERIQIEITNRCNYTCGMCPRESFNLPEKDIQLDLFKKIIEVKEGHPSNKVVQKNMESLIRSRGDKKKPMITIQITMHDKKQCLETVKYAGEVGSDRVYLVRLNIPFGMNSFKRPNLEEELEIYKESEEIAKKYGLQVDNNFTAFDNQLLRSLYKKLRPVMYRSDKYCPKPYDYLYINIDGRATPCCDLPRYEVGNVLKKSIDEIWHGKNMM